MAALLLLVLSTTTQVDKRRIEIDRLVEELSADRIEAREQAATRLKELGELSVPRLEAAVAGPDPEKAGRAREILRRISIQRALGERLLRAIPHLEDRLAGGTDRTWTEVFLEVKATSGTEASPPIGKEVLEPLAARALRGAQTREEAACVLEVAGEWGFRSLVPEVLKLVSNADAVVRREAALCLGELRAKEGIPPLLRLLRDKKLIVRWGAAEALAQIREKEIIPAVLLVLGGTDPEALPSAVWLLGKLGAREAVPEILPLLESEDPLLRGHAASALGTLGAKEATPKLIGLLGDETPVVRINAAQALARLGAQGAVMPIERLLGDDSDAVRRAALRALGTLRAKVAIPAVTRSLSDPDREVQIVAAVTLSELGSKEGVYLLLKEEVHLAVLNALREPGGWERLQGAGKGKLEGTRGEILRQLGESVGMRIRTSDSAAPLKDTPGEPGGPLDLEVWPTLFDALLSALDWRSTVILEKDEIRVVTRREAHDFWEAWSR
jgi:HEAT repeat protein